MQEVTTTVTTTTTNATAAQASTKLAPMMSDSIILQADATVIAGLLILLTITYALARRSPEEDPKLFAQKTVTKISQLVIILVIPFSASAILAALGNVYDLGIAAVVLMMIGLGVLAVGVSWLVWGEATRRFGVVPPGTRA